MTGDVQSLDDWRARHGADAEAMSRRAAAATVYVSRAEEALALLPDARDEDARVALRTITETWLHMATAELSARATQA
jgi:hypothetical protein